MSGLSHDISALVANHAAGDDESFYAVARDVATRELRDGRRNSAQEIHNAVNAATGEKASEDEDLDAEYTDALVDSDLTEYIEVTRPKGHLDDLIISDDLIERLRQLIAEHRSEEELKEAGLYPAYRVLLEGPAGTGKTATAKILASELGLPLVTVWLDSLLAAYSEDEDVRSLRGVFKKLTQRNAIFLFDMFGVVAIEHRDARDRGVFRAFMMFLDEIQPGSIALAATNRREALERYMFRHFDVVLNFSLPDPRVAVQVMRNELGNLAPDVTVNEADVYGQYMPGLSHAELVLAAQDAAKAAVLRGATQVTQDDLIFALTNRGAHMLNDHED
ncbi:MULTISPECIES: AAA family ATPase [Auritidibacter]|uniref:AAA family ATPase n=1 Tax=Auritidibacter TaxID=1160973 RepID=UPI000D731E2C|nr:MULTISPECIES: AAA family ATPase [Auritidibacter]AXR74739.1 ATP-binding protein [Auritidibacter sp. NML130574]NIH71133.1 SpoVK/Ycf46/Vps4 family AAA+-type ATPase [Auritidibacter ignavus]PXA79410.1 AAA family ATPase [Auritidibacter sp. NML120636]RMX22932.1 ATP-binding protein [Auritidibacter ignavus]WGH81272.1 AAA family ATPase [Auritidibacter ignavus]